MRPRKLIAIAEEVRDCPLFRADGRMVFLLPEVVPEASTAVCSYAVSALVPFLLKTSVRRREEETEADRIACPGCRDGQAMTVFRLEDGGEEPSAEEEMRLDPEKALALDVLEASPLFAHLSPRSLCRIVPYFRIEKLAAGATVLRHGEEGTLLFLVARGVAEVSRIDSSGVPRLLDLKKRGDCFGEMSLLTGQPTSADVTARTDLTCLVMTRRSFDLVRALFPGLHLYFSRMLAQRLVRTTTRVLEQGESGIQGKLTMLGPAELIQALHVANRTGVLRIKSGNRSCRLDFATGRLMAAFLGTQRGPEAVWSFLCWKRGAFTFTPSTETSSAANVEEDTVPLLIEGLRRLDESTRIQRDPAATPEARP